jgi:glycosyltransferase involved in cell wall biosynthesis
MMPDYLNRTSRVRTAVARLTCRFSDRIICVNQEMRATIVHLGVPDDRIEVKEAYLPTPVPPIEANPRFEAWLKEHSPLLTTTMFLRPEYGYEILEAAMPILRMRYPKIGLVVMGIDGTAPDSSIFRAGDVEHGLCLHLMSRCNAFVRPTFNDGDSVSVREAHALGVPVVASDIGNRPPGTYLFRPGDVNGFVEQVEKALEGLHAHSDGAVSIRKAGFFGNESCEVS